MLKLYNEICKLKTLLRKGWIVRQVSDNGRIESDAEHTFSMLYLALEIIHKENLQLNTEKVLKMIIYHELGEIDFGDSTPLDNISKEDKFNNELKCIERLCELSQMQEIKNLWLEFEENKTEEAQFVKMIDKLDAVMQSKIYAHLNNKPQLFEEFYNNALDKIKGYEKYTD